jgi:uncharacterized protein YggT (Ycf19 family)
MSANTGLTPTPPQPAESAGGDTKLWLLKVAKGVVVFTYAFVLVNLVMLLLGFFLRLFGASTDASFTRWVYRSVDRIMEPFRGMFRSRTLSEDSVIDVSLLFAMIVYCIVALALHALVVWLAGRIVSLRRQQELAETRAAEAHARELAMQAQAQAVTQAQMGQRVPTQTR